MPTIDSVLTRAAQRAPDHIAVREWQGRQLSYAELDAAVSSFAAWARTNGVQAGDAIAIHLPNSIAWPVAQFGSFRAGAVATYVSYRLMPAEARRQFAIGQVRLIVTTPEKAAELRADPALADTLFVVDGPAKNGTHSLGDIIATGLRPDFHTDGLEDSDAIIRFTSGSTGDPKGLIVTHRAWLLRAVCMQTEEMRIRPGSTTLLLGQLSHQAGLFVLPTFLQNGTLLVMSKFSLDTVADILATGEVSCAQVVPTMFTMMLNHPRARAALAASKLHTVIYGGSPIRQGVLAEAMAVLSETEFLQSYGSHEAGSITVLDGAAHRDPKLRHSAGRPFLAVQLRLREPNADGVGEIEAQSPWLPNARLTAQGREPITEAWSRTGDLGEIVDGHVYLRDRMNDVIISGGFNVYPVEVEKVIGAHPQVLDAAVASAPDEQWGERVIAFVVPREPGAFNEAAMREHCKALLAGYKVPKEFHLIPEMPLNVNGKPDRRSLVQPLWAGLERRIN
ncbi:class I adenylate-forming enzyme family protein [Hydrogenophaga sp. BPS33]|uniref:class I adenylate-forming enzyme family protein n=1 Tax=Hydrogenophaga sp. BPS33 TaxID=2651974 RepID=UPI00131FC2E2|nr:class I adenylate-forming enzyme family protein [Hydrogenophaga sp. BPS33]QHE83970.1 acyl--CoA ligase [Hydrogenophaga sp. BPS33]